MVTESGASQLSPELDLLLRRAAWIGQRDGVPTASVTSIFLSLLCGSDSWSRWAQETARRTGVTLEKVLARWKESGVQPQEFSPVKLEEAWNRDAAAFSNASYTKPAHWLTARIAEDALSNRVIPDVRHLIGAYIYSLLPYLHEAKLAAWGFRPSRWAVLFFPELRRRYPDETGSYAGVHARFDRPISSAIDEAAQWGASLEGLDSASARDLLRGILVVGAAKAGDFAPEWFLKQLGVGGNAGALLGKTIPLELSADVKVTMDPDALELIDRARLFGTASLDGSVRVRHVLLAAFTGRRFPAPELLSHGKRRIPELIEALLDWLSGKGWDDIDALQELTALAKAARPPPEERAVVLDNDEAHGDDQLGVLPDAHAMASVLASKDLRPPLSVGLFGDWGSGKSFFMSLLRKRINNLAQASREARKAGKPTSFYGDIIQIEFNAWQYMDANLWASIIAHIFDQLGAELRERDKPPATKYLSELASVREEQETLLRERGKLHGEISGVGGQLAALRKEREERKLSWLDVGEEILRRRDEDEGVKRSLAEAASLAGLDRARVSVEEARRELEDLRHAAGKIATWARSIRQSPKKLLLVLVILFGPIALGVGVMLATRYLQLAGGWIALATGSLAGLIAVVRQVRAVAGSAFRAFDSAMKQADAAEQRARERVMDEERRAQAEQQRLAAEESKLEQRRAELARRREELETKLAELKDAASYKRFVLDRAASSDYRGQLGLITTIHRDLRTLSQKLKEPQEPHVDRIILYIDDLDRCPPDRVVEVLQAVHLILSLELFVVVVAVDSRWLLQSLEAYYRRHFGERRHLVDDLSHGHRESDPQHYLEKIFQIPYAIAPMSGSGFGSLVQSLLGKNVVRNVAARAGALRAGEPLVSHASGLSQAQPQLHSGGSLRVVETSTSNLTPRGLEITQDELENLQALGAPESGRLLASPRAVKRMVNLYRIARAGLDEESLDQFLEGSYRLHQLFLAAVVGAPKETAALIDALLERQVSNREALAKFLAERRDQGDAWRALHRAFSNEPLLGDWPAVAEAAQSAARFSFQTGRVLREVGTATASPETPAPPRRTTPRPS